MAAPTLAQLAVPRLGSHAACDRWPNGARGTAFRATSSACFPCGSALAPPGTPPCRTRRRRTRGELSRRARCAARPDGETSSARRSASRLRVLRGGPGAFGATHRRVRAWLQAHGVGACVKHFVANDVEWEPIAPAQMDERTLRESISRRSSRRAGGRRVTVMLLQPPRRHALHRAPATAQDILRGEWSFDGVVISDWLATQFDGAVGDGRHGPRDAGSAAPLRRPDRRCVKRVNSTNCRRRLRAPPPRAAREDRRARPCASASTPPSRRSTAPTPASAPRPPPPIVLLRNEAGALPSTKI